MSTQCPTSRLDKNINAIRRATTRFSGVQSWVAIGLAAAYTIDE